MLTLVALLVGGFAALKAAQRWATPLMARYRPQGVLDPSAMGFNAGTDDSGSG
jgi:hypothetical protein